MPEDEQCLENNLAVFVSLLRQEGLPVGTTELTDALQALQVAGLASRATFKNALRATLVKSKKYEHIFAALFDQFFVCHDEHLRRTDELKVKRQVLEQKITAAESALRFKGEGLDLSAAEFEQFSDLAPEHRSRLLRFVKRTERGNRVERHFKPVLENIVKSHLRYWRAKDEQKPGGSSAAVADGAGSGSGSTADQLLREMDIERVAQADLPAAEELLARLSRQLAVKILRRKRSGARSAQLDIRRCIRHNMQYGGIVFNLKYKPKRRLRQQVLMLCDVSASMKNYSAFVIHFLYNLQETVRDLSCFAFSDHLEDLSASLKGRSSLTYLTNRVIRHSETWGGGTNLGAALRTLLEKHAHLLNHKTTVIVVSDTKTIDLGGAVKALAALNENVKRIIWLNPLAAHLWPDYQSVSLMAKEAEMWPCSTIGQLEEALAKRF